MSRKSRRSRTRDTNAIANRRLRFNFRPSIRSLAVSFRNLLRSIEDRREFHPDPYRPAAGYDSSRHRLKYYEQVSPRKITAAIPNHLQNNLVFPSAAIGFENPSRVAICRRRTTRREVMHALGHAGSGRSQRRPRFNSYSQVRC